MDLAGSTPAHYTMNMTSLNDKWIPPGSKCDLCQRPKREGERWWDTHSYCFTFNFCTECEKDRDEECMNVVGTVVSEHIRKNREYWATHPEELAEHNRQTAEYRKTLDADGYPMNFKRSWWKRVVNWVRRKTGFTMFDRNGRKRWTD